MGRPRGKKFTIRLSVVLESHTFEALSSLAEMEGLPVAWVVRKAVTELVERCKGEDKSAALISKLAKKEPKSKKA